MIEQTGKVECHWVQEIIIQGRTKMLLDAEKCGAIDTDTRER